MIRTAKKRARDIYLRLPSNRRVKGLGGLTGRLTLLARTMLQPLLPMNVTLTDSRGVRFFVTRDPVDARVVDDLTGGRRAMWFPSEPVPADVFVVLDVGGHHGHYVAAAIEQYPGAEIISLEPAARGAELIARHAEMNGATDRVEIIQAAIAETTGEGTLHHDPDGSWGASLYEVGGEVETVSLTTLEDVLRGRDPDIIKCNAEGGEYDLIPQVLSLGLRPSLIILMVHPEFGDADSLLRSLTRADFSLESVGTAHRPAYHVRPVG